MGKTLICLVHVNTDERGNLFRATKWKLEDVAEAIKLFVDPATVWLHDGSTPAESAILYLAPRFGISVCKQELEDAITVADSLHELRRTLPVRYVPSLGAYSIQGPHHSEMEELRKEIFTHFDKGANVLAFMNKPYFLALFAYLKGKPYPGDVAAGDAVVLQFSGKEQALGGEPVGVQDEQQFPLWTVGLILENSIHISG